MSADELVAVFAATSGGRPPGTLGAILTALCDQARSAYPDLGLTDRELVIALASHAPRDAVEAFCTRCHAPALALAVAAGRGSDAAITALELAFGSTLASVCRRFAGHGNTEDDLLQLLRTKLFVAEPGQAPTITHYNGQGSLASWLRVTATRLFIDQGRRKDRARETVSDPADLEAIEPTHLALDLVKAEYRSAVASAMVTAARQLEPGDRHLLRQHLVAGLTIDQLGAVLGIHRATAARRLAAAREALAGKTRELVAARLQLDERELSELFGLIVSKLDLSIRRLLETKPA